MKFRIIFALTATGCLSAGVMLGANSGNNPYHTIVERNVFGLVPIPVHDPADDVPTVPPPKITPNGIMTLFGKLQVLFKVAAPARPGQPPQDESHVMGEGDREDDITVQKIDEAAATITFDNHGVIQQLPLVASGAAGSGGSTAAARGPAPSPGVASGVATPANFGGRFGRNRLTPAPATANPPDATPTPSAPSVNSAATSAAPNGPAEEISPEEQIISMEAQRAKWLDEGDPAAAIMPPTEITKQVMGEGDAGDKGGNAGPPGPPAP